VGYWTSLDSRGRDKPGVKKSEKMVSNSAKKAFLCQNKNFFLVLKPHWQDLSAWVVQPFTTFWRLKNLFLCLRKREWRKVGQPGWQLVQRIARLL
jgi:hypothetical protein